MEKIKTVIDELSNLSLEIIGTFDDYVGNIEGDIETWFTTFLSENLPEDLIDFITTEFTNLLSEQFELFGAIVQTFTIEQIEGYIMVYQMENGESPYNF